MFNRDRHFVAPLLRGLVASPRPYDIGSGSRILPIFGGSGMNSSLSRSGSFMRPALQSSRA